MGNYFNQSRGRVSGFHITTAPAVFFKSRAGSQKPLSAVVTSLTSCAKEGNKKSDEWKLKDRIRLKDKTTGDSSNFHRFLRFLSSLAKSVFSIQLNKATPILFAMILFNPISVWAATYYISPSGSDSYSGTSTSSPWKTFAHAISRLLPGDTLILRDGTYTKSTTGLPNINCGYGGKNAQSGTSTQPITIQAEHERQAFLKSDGSTAALWLQYCAYWNIQGLHGASADLSSANGGSQLSIFQITYASHINLRRLLADHTNRCFNSHGILVQNSSDSLVEESEVYYYHRWSIIPYGSTRITQRRNYSNSRNYPSNSSCRPSSDIYPNGGDFGEGFYGGTDSIIEDGITENAQNAAVGGTGNGGNQIFGYIGLNSGSCAQFNVSGSMSAPLPIKDLVCVNDAEGLWNRGGWIVVTGATFYISNQIAGAGGNGVGAEADNNNGSATGTNQKTSLTNALSLSNARYGVSIWYQDSWLVSYSNSFYNKGNYYLPGSPQNSLSTLPTYMGLGTNQCIVYVPSNSNMRRAGQNGADIGANLIYRYQKGVLTTTKLWDQSTGRFSCGATVAGLNDDPNGSTVGTQACINVNKRLNVGVNGCPIP